MSEPVNGWLSESQQRVWRSYLLAKTHIDDYLEEALRDFGLSLAEYELLVRLSESPDHTIRMGELADSSLIARKIGHFSNVLCAAPSYLERHGAPGSIDEYGWKSVIRVRMSRSRITTKCHGLSLPAEGAYIAERKRSRMSSSETFSSV